jgi:hypothetical protein
MMCDHLGDAALGSQVKAYEDAKRFLRGVALLSSLADNQVSSLHHVLASDTSVTNRRLLS